MTPMSINIFTVKEELVGCSVAITLKGNSVPIRGKVAIFDDPRHFLAVIDEKKPSCAWIQITEIAAFELEGQYDDMKSKKHSDQGRFNVNLKKSVFKQNENTTEENQLQVFSTLDMCLR